MGRTLISIVDDDEPYRDSIQKLVRLSGYTVEAFSSAAEFLGSRLLPETSCLVADVHMPGISGMTGTELHERLVESGTRSRRSS
jgi:FixJ family two-component response regulator